MDPISALVTCWAVAYLVGRLPEALAEVEWAKQGEQSPKLEARTKRLADAGIDPATGGAMRQYVGNAWRDVWLDLDEQRRARRDARAPYDPADTSWWGRLRDWFAARVDEATAEWRRRNSGDGGHDREDGGGAGADSSDDEPDTGQGDDPETGQTLDDPPDPDGDGDTFDDPHSEPETADDAAAAATGPEPELPPLPPLRGTLTRRDQTDEGADMTTALNRGGAVTGVVSGAAEAHAIAREVEAANAEYIARMGRVRNRIVSLGEQTASIVQMSLRSRVIQLTVQAAEAAAQAQADAKRCGGEVGPVLVSVARAFERLNS